MRTANRSVGSSDSIFAGGRGVTKMTPLFLSDPLRSDKRWSAYLGIAARISNYELVEISAIYHNPSRLFLPPNTARYGGLFPTGPQPISSPRPESSSSHACD